MAGQSEKRILWEGESQLWSDQREYQVSIQQIIRADLWEKWIGLEYTRTAETVERERDY